MLWPTVSWVSSLLSLHCFLSTSFLSAATLFRALQKTNCSRSSQFHYSPPIWYNFIPKQKICNDYLQELSKVDLIGPVIKNAEGIQQTNASYTYICTIYLYIWSFYIYLLGRFLLEKKYVFLSLNLLTSAATPFVACRICNDN